MLPRLLLPLSLLAIAEGVLPSVGLPSRTLALPTTPLRAARCLPGAFRLLDDGAAADAADSAAAEPEGDDSGVGEPAEGEIVEEDDLLTSPAFLKQKVKVLEKDLQEVSEKLRELKDGELSVREEWREKRERLDTDFANYKARHYNETLSKQNDAKVELIQSFLPLLDNLDRAKAASTTEGDAQIALNDRYLALCASLLSSLEEMGLERMETVGKEFDYNLHNAIQQVPSDEFPENVVCSELQSGYTCGGKLVRAAYVMVSSG